MPSESPPRSVMGESAGVDPILKRRLKYKLNRLLISRATECQFPEAARWQQLITRGKAR